MPTVTDIIDRLGKRNAVSEALGIPYTTVQAWEVANFVPEWRRPALLEMAMRVGKPLSTSEFPAKPIKRRKLAA